MKNYVLWIGGSILLPYRKYLLMMKMLIAFLLCSVLQIQASSLAQTVTIEQKGMSFVNILREIKKQTGYTIICNSDIIKSTPSSDVRMKDTPLKEALEVILMPKNLSYHVEGKSIVVKKGKQKNIVLQKEIEDSAIQQTRIIRGRVSNEAGTPLSGISVLIKGTTIGTSTNDNGLYTIEVPVGNSVLVFSSVGFTTQEISTEGRTEVSVVLQEMTSDLDEVVVTALGIKREQKALGYAVQKVGGAEVSTAKGVDFATSLTGRVAGLNIKNSTEFSIARCIELRGQSPLIVIDGVATQFVSLRDIPADDIEDVTVLKGATASALYGSRGGAGALMITTKRSKNKGLDIQINSSTMSDAGYLVRPEVQTSYSTGQGGIYQAGSYVWGDKLDIGRTAMIHNPYTFEKEETLLVS